MTNWEGGWEVKTVQVPFAEFYGTPKMYPGWEPFAVTRIEGESGATLWMRRCHPKAAAKEEA